MGFYEPNSNLLLLQVLRGLLAREETGAIPHKGSYSVLQGEKSLKASTVLTSKYAHVRTDVSERQ